MSISPAFPDMATVDREYRRLFLHGLARLARQGFVAQPGDTEDLLQDFYANCYRGLKERYDPAAGTTENYLYSAFLRYARQRICRSRRWHQRLRDLSSIAEELADRGAGSPLDQMVLDEEARLLGAALAGLADPPRTFLLEFFAAGPHSRRKLADRHAITCYRVDEHLINAFGQLVTRLAPRLTWSRADEQVARLFWCEGCDLEEAALRSGRPVAAVLEQRDRLKKALVAELRPSRSSRSSRSVKQIPDTVR